MRSIQTAFSFTRDFKRNLLVLSIAFIALLKVGSAQAVPIFLDEWKALYPDSSSSNRGCQLCHAFAEGGEPWNAYGFDIRSFYQGGLVEFATALEIVEEINSDGPPNGSNDLTNIEEINLNLDPGWAPGRVNIHAYKNGDVVRNQPPPFAERDDETICFAIVASVNGRVVMVCL